MVGVHHLKNLKNQKAIKRLTSGARGGRMRGRNMMTEGIFRKICEIAGAVEGDGAGYFLSENA